MNEAAKKFGILMKKCFSNAEALMYFLAAGKLPEKEKSLFGSTIPHVSAEKN